jgi:hypothetical protein
MPYNKFFEFFAENKFEPPYYNALGYLLTDILRKKFSKFKKWKLFDS